MIVAHIRAQSQSCRVIIRAYDSFTGTGINGLPLLAAHRLMQRCNPFVLSRTVAINQEIIRHAY
ncbi:hypothetical protein GCM10022405_41660 [Gibbsiella dentisursi]|uniref:Uncharacterized protein n=1 Tax=Gibbsiella dentisursi TaxID=796890 RepID=A0ABP7M448_9GAMM